MKNKKIFSTIRIALFILVIAVGCVAGFIISLRPAVSESEGRELTLFPEFTPESFLSGEYTSKINLWYSDTLPARDELMMGNSLLKSLYGIKTEDFGGKGDKDDIDFDRDFIWEDDTPPGDIDTFTESVTEGIEDFTEDNTSEMPTEKETEPPEKEVIDGYYVNGDTAYQLYYFDQALVDRYT